MSFLIAYNVLSKKRNDMKEEILQIAYSLEKGKIDERIAKQELCVLLGVSDSYIKCWNCKHFTQTSTKHANKEVGNCGLHKCKVTDPKWQKCGEYDQCGLLTTFNFR